MTIEPVKKVHPLKCSKCGYTTPHAEDRVNDLESATVWHCLICGNERRPPEKGTPNEPVFPKRMPPSDRNRIEKKIERKIEREKELVHEH